MTLDKTKLFHTILRLVAAVLVLVLIAAALAYIGYGRWWGKADAREIRNAIKGRLYSNPAYRGYTQYLLRSEGIRPAVQLVPDDSSTEDQRKGLNHIARGAGKIPDGQYQGVLFAETSFHSQLFKQPIELKDYVGAVALRIHNGLLVKLSVDTGKLATSSLLRAKLASLLTAVPRTEFDAKYPNARVELLDGRACDFRTAKHIERLFANFAGWPEFAVQRLIHAGFVARLGEAGDHYQRGSFALASGPHLGLPQALRLGSDESCRVCVLVTTVNSFGEPIDDAQAIVSLERVGTKPPVVREVLRVDAGEFDADAVNGLLAGHLAYPWIGTVATLAGVVVFMLLLRFLLGIFVQIKILFAATPQSVVVDRVKSGESDTTATTG
jgi:hypothetical protein